MFPKLSSAAEFHSIGNRDGFTGSPFYQVESLSRSRKMHARNLGRQPDVTMLSTVDIINSLDEATRVKVLAELPEALRRRYLAEQHAAGFLSAARQNFNSNTTQQMLASGFVNLSAPESAVGQTVKSFTARTAGSSHAIMKTSATSASYNSGIMTTAASQSHGTQTAHHIAARLPTGSGINNLDLNPAVGNGLSGQGFLGSHSQGARISGASLSQGTHARSVGLGLSPRVGSNRASTPGANTSHSNDPSASIVHNTTVITTARQLGAASAANMQMSKAHSAGNPMHLNGPHRFSTLPGSFPPGINGHLVRQKTIISTYLDDFKQGFPTNGLSSVSSRWWGSAEVDKTSEKLSFVENSSRKSSKTDISEPEDAVPREDTVPGQCRPSLTVSASKGKDASGLIDSWRRVTRTRRKAVLRGKKALQLGVAKGYGVQKLGQKEGAILQFVFGN